MTYLITIKKSLARASMELSFSEEFKLGPAAQARREELGWPLTAGVGCSLSCCFVPWLW